MWIYFCDFDSILLINLSIFMSISCDFYYYCSEVQLTIRDRDTTRNYLIIQDCFSYPGFFVFLYEIENCSFKVCNVLCWNFDVNCMLLLPIHGQGRYFHPNIFLNFFLQRHKVLVIQDLHIICQSYTKIFYIFCDYCEECCSPNFFLNLFIIFIQEKY